LELKPVLNWSVEAAMGGEFQSCWHGVDISGGGIIALVLSVLSILFYSIAIGTDAWATASANPPTILNPVNMGLWTYCTNNCQKCMIPNDLL
jgi:hypothetical protein